MELKFNIDYDDCKTLAHYCNNHGKAYTEPCPVGVFECPLGHVEGVVSEHHFCEKVTVDDWIKLVSEKA